MSNGDRKQSGRALAENMLLFASVGDTYTASRNTRVRNDEPMDSVQEVPMPSLSPRIRANSRRRSVLELIPALGTTRGDYLEASPNKEQPRARIPDVPGPLISTPNHPQLSLIPLAGAGSQVLPFLISHSSMNDAPPSDSSFPLITLQLAHMETAAIIALGAGAFVTTAVAGTLLLHGKMGGVLARTGLGSFRRKAEVDIEKGPAQGVERKGWKEFTGDDEKEANPTSELLAPLIVALPKETDVADVSVIRTPLSAERLISASSQCCELPSAPVDEPRAEVRSASPTRVPLLEGDISDTREWDHAPSLPLGLDVEVAVVKPLLALETHSSWAAGLEPLDVSMDGVISWPVLVPTPVEELRREAPIEELKELAPNLATVNHEPKLNDQAEPLDRPPVNPIAPPEDDNLFLQEPREPPEVIKDPFTDPADHYCHDSEPPLNELEDISPIHNFEDILIPPIVSDIRLDSYLAEEPSVQEVTSGTNVTHADILDVVFAASVLLPDSPLPSPKLTSLRLVLHEFHEDLVGHRVVTELDVPYPPSVSETTSPRSSLDEISPTTSYPAALKPFSLDDYDEIPDSPLSYTSCSSLSSSCSSGPETPIELKQTFAFDSAIGTLCKAVPIALLPDDEPELADDFVVVEAVDVLDDVSTTREQAPDPPCPTIDCASSDWEMFRLPGSFQNAKPQTSMTTDLMGPEQKLLGANVTQPATVPLLTADMIQLYRAMLAMSSCAGLVAQFFIGFSVWWSMALVPG
ncbi:hypothetical protein CTheo_4987 [Ceratobasidium theobromae]|uniref:Transmembrane protein n=1 Tax=Ceratobasidium theobromae TaxID=1582974 RepID=A0A5N5QJ94_9AGAM|nr:hypothetical protein CTheo_4987 [Ceratobasidium theobromae]